MDLFILLELSASFDAVDRAILLSRLQQTFGDDGTAHRRVSVVSSRPGTVECPSRRCPVYHRPSPLRRTRAGFSSRLCLPLFFIMYTVDLTTLVERHNLSPHRYMPTTRKSTDRATCDADAFATSDAECTHEVAGRMTSDGLQLNSIKAAVLLWCATSRRRRHQRPTSPSQLTTVTR